MPRRVVIDVVLLLMTFFLELFGASTDASFTQWVYRSSARAMEPFRGIFPSHPISDTSVWDTSVLFAAMIYSFVALGFHIAYEWFGHQITRRDVVRPLARIEPPPAAPPVNPTLTP